MSAQPKRPVPQPWSMKWIVLAIVVFVAIYTAVEFYSRKPGPGYRPYQDSQDRATTARLLAAGWAKVPLDTRRPIEKPTAEESSAQITRAALGLGVDLEAKFAEKPKLLATVDHVNAPASVAHGHDYVAYFTASLSDLKLQVGEISLYRKGNELVVIPTTENLPGKELMSRWTDSTYWIAFSSATLPPGRYDMRVVAKGPALAWSFSVK